jgi:hypothetical protein
MSVFQHGYLHRRDPHAVGSEQNPGLRIRFLPETQTNGERSAGSVTSTLA